MNKKQYKPRKVKNFFPRKSPLLLILLILVWCLIFGVGIATALAPKNVVKSMDIVPNELQLAQELYVEQCGSCHLAIPPETMPTQTWKELLENPQAHYGVALTNVIPADILIMWKYVRDFSRSLEEDEDVPFRVADSRFFQALHPKVELSQPVTHRSCIVCHPGAKEFNFRVE